jgi:hypothetical protein
MEDADHSGGAMYYIRALRHGDDSATSEHTLLLLLTCHYLYFCSSKASKVSTSSARRSSARVLPSSPAAGSSRSKMRASFASTRPRAIRCRTAHPPTERASERGGREGGREGGGGWCVSVCARAVRLRGVVVVQDIISVRKRHVTCRCDSTSTCHDARAERGREEERESGREGVRERGREGERERASERACATGLELGYYALFE